MPATTTTMATTATTTTLTTTDVVMAKETAVVAIPAPEGALVMRPISPDTLPNDVVMPVQTAVGALQGNPLINYFISKRDKTKAANPNASFNDIKVIIQKEWCKLSKEERAKYENEIESVQAEVTTIITDGDSESKSDAESTVEDVGNPFTLTELVHQGGNVSDEAVKAFIDLIHENIRVVVLGGMPFSNELADSLYEDYADGFGHQEKHERGTMQNTTMRKIINSTNDDPDSTDQVGMFLREKLGLVEKALGKVCDGFLNLNRGQEKTPEQEQSKAPGSKSWHSDKFKEDILGRCIMQYLQRGKQGALLLRPYRNENLVVRVNIPHDCVVYFSKEILGFRTGNEQFPRCEHMHCNQGASVSWVMDLKLDIKNIESSTCSAIEAASRMQDEMNLDLEGRWGGDKWEPDHFKGSPSRDFRFKPRECTVVTNASGRIVLVCSRMQSLTNGVERAGVALFDILGQQDGLTVQGIERCSHTGGFEVGVLRVFPFKHFAGLGLTSGQLAALIDADPEAKEELANLLTENSNRTASQEVEITLFDDDGIVIAGPSRHESLRAGKNNKDTNKVTIPNLPTSMAKDGSKVITAKMIHAATIATRGEGLRIPKSTVGRNSKACGHWLIHFTGVTTTRRDATREGISKRKR